MALYTISDSMANLQYIGKMLHRENHGLFMTGLWVCGMGQENSHPPETAGRSWRGWHVATP